MTISDSLGSLLGNLRGNKNQSEVARRLEWDQSKLSRIENDQRTPTEEELHQLLEVLNPSERERSAIVTAHRSLLIERSASRRRTSKTDISVLSDELARSGRDLAEIRRFLGLGDASRRGPFTRAAHTILEKCAELESLPDERRPRASRLLLRELEDLAMKVVAVPSGVWSARAPDEVTDLWSSLLDEATPGKVTIAVSAAAPSWWNIARNEAWLGWNQRAVERGVLLVRIFIVQRKILLNQPTEFGQFLEVMARVAKAGVQVNLAWEEDLAPGLARDRLVVDLDVETTGDRPRISNLNDFIHYPVNEAKQLKVSGSTSVSAVQELAEDRVRIRRIEVSERPADVWREVDATEHIYRVSTRFPDPNFYSSRTNWLPVFYDNYWRKIAEAYRPNPPAEVEALSVFLSESGGRLEAGSRILDLGCGYGRLTVPLASKLHELTVVGVDENQEYIDEAKTYGVGLCNSTFARMELRDLSPESVRAVLETDEVVKFDLVASMFGSFSHDLGAVVDGSRRDPREQDRQVLRALASVMAKGGIAVFDQDNLRFIQERSRLREPMDKRGILRWDHFRPAESGYPALRLSQFVFKDTSPIGCRPVARLILYPFGDFEDLLSSEGFKIRNVYGDYVLDSEGSPVSYDENNSPRMVVSAEYTG